GVLLAQGGKRGSVAWIGVGDRRGRAADQDKGELAPVLVVAVHDQGGAAGRVDVAEALEAAAGLRLLVDDRVERAIQQDVDAGDDVRLPAGTGRRQPADAGGADEFDRPLRRV